MPLFPAGRAVGGGRRKKGSKLSEILLFISGPEATLSTTRCRCCTSYICQPRGADTCCDGSSIAAALDVRCQRMLHAVFIAEEPAALANSP